MRRAIFGMWLLASCMCATVGCGGGGNGDGQGGSSSGGAVRGCEIFGETWCERAIGCSVELGTLPSSELDTGLDVCTDVATAAAQCDHAVELGPTYDQCLQEIDAKPCSDWNVPMSELGSVTPPSSCRGQILVRL